MEGKSRIAQIGNITNPAIHLIDNLGLPPLAGIATHEEARRSGISIEENVAWLRRCDYIKVRLVEIMSANITSLSEWEIKAGLSLHMWLDSEHSTMIRRQMGEITEPLLKANSIHDESLKLWLDEVLCARNAIELIIGIYWVIKPALSHAIKEHLEKINPLIDHPTVRLLRLILLEEEEMQAWGSKVIRGLILKADDEELAEAWETHLNHFLERQGGICGVVSRSSANTEVELHTKGALSSMDLASRRDLLFHDVVNSDERKYAPVFKRFRKLACKNTTPL